MADAFGQVLSQSILHRSPACSIEPFLIVYVNLHEEVIPDEVSLRQSTAFGVQAFKNEVGIVVAVEYDTHQNQLAHNNMFQLFKIWDLVRTDFAFEELVVTGYLIVLRGDFVPYDREK